MELTTILLIFFSLLILNYIVNVAWSRLSVRSWEGQIPEGFTDVSGSEGTMASLTETRWIPSPELFDSFYAQVYDQLFQGSTRLQAETGLALHAFKSNGTSLKEMRILDAGCGTGIVSTALAKMNVAKVIGVDVSVAMIDRAKKVTLPESTLTPEQKAVIEFRNSDLLNPSSLAPGEVTNAIVFYFVIYYLHDLDAFFRNMFVWVKPGGMIAVEAVNKYKFDPMLDSAAPWVGFSLQKYSKDRITDSKVTFDKFTYEGKFDLIDPVAEFRETFRFKDGSVRRQKHTLYMPSIEEIVKIAKAAGWQYKSYVDLTSIGFEYAYLLLFTHP
jgi:2-polyprenyl-3-methyl-5-hydroxy-6-metoxy-1,4-benzoquinol methylase